MSDAPLSPDSTTASAAGAPSGSMPSGPAQQAGAMLREARERAGLHAAALAAALKVPVRKLEALEAGRFDLLPDIAFARGLAASICRGLKVDPQPVLALMPAIGGPDVPVAPPAINTRFEPGSSAGAARRGRLSPAMWAVAVLLLGALAIYLWPTGADAPAEPEAATVPEEPAQAAAPGLVTERVAPGAEPAPAVAAAPLAPAQPAANAAVPAPVAPPPAAGLLRFDVKAETWARVTDATGKVLLRRTLKAGESVPVDGTPPLEVVVGRIDAVEIQVRGQVQDVRSAARSGVARFEVK
ncbi:helix-turn-helix domain-containing protein [Pseudorhodoferax sp.]|uniref:helix-turn-helix domain-containing protein n=1 Tax=Pseudorhodoferax sp. TaxID=1993553 RepID=UPI0039E5F9BB